MPPDIAPYAAEALRLAALQELGILDTPPEAAFDTLVQVAARICGVPISLLGLLDAERQWFKANLGLPGVQQQPRAMAFCDDCAIAGEDVLEIPDVRRDPRVAENALVADVPDFRFYAGAPLRLSNGQAVGTLCVIDRRPRRLDEQQRDTLRDLARVTAWALESWHAGQAQQKTAAALERTQTRLRRIYENTPAMLQSLDAAGRLVTVSDWWLERLGYTREEVIGRPAAAFMTPESSATARAVGPEMLTNSGRRDRLAVQYVAHGGEIVDMRMSIVTERGEDGEPCGQLAVIEEATVQMQVERALAEERQRLASIIEATEVGTWEWQVQTGELRINERWAAILGWTVAELLPLSIETANRLIHPDDQLVSQARLAQHFAGSLPLYEMEMRMRHRSGHWVWVLSHGKVLSRTADDAPAWMYGKISDISASKQQQRALRRSEDFLNRTGEIAGAGAWEIDLATGEHSWSAETCRLHGVPPEYPPTTEGFIAFYTPEAQPLVRAAIERMAAGGAAMDLELPFVRADGRSRWARCTGTVTLAGGRPVRLSGSFQDVTERVMERQALEQARQRALLATESGGIGIWDRDLVTDMMLWDDAVYRLHGMAVGDGIVAYDLWRSQIHPDDRDRVDAAVAAAIAGRAPFDAEYRVVWPGGALRYLRSTGHVTCDAAGRPVRMVGTSRDITEPRRLAAELAEQHELLKVTLTSIGDGVITADGQGHVTWLNPVAEDMTGWSAAEAAGRPIVEVFRIVHEQTRAAAENPLQRCLAEGRIVGLADNTVLISRDGREFGIADSASPIRSAGGTILGMVLVFHDVTEQRRMSGEMSHRATHDALTGLVNRVEFEVRLRRLLQQAQTDDSRNALLYIDLDQFKIINDTAGHAVGDMLLRQVARLLADVVRTSDTLARLGGDEFAVILTQCSEAQAQRLAQRICDRMEEFRFVHEERRFRIGASIGLVPVDARWSSTTAILQAADGACYTAKEAGRNRVHTWFDTDPAMQARQGQMQWVTRLEHALDEDRFVLFAQRIESLAGPAGTPAAALAGDVPPLHAEVLLRMRNGDGTLVAPGVFLPAAERFHMASRIDRWVLRQVLLWMAALPQPEQLATLSVNLSGQSVGDRAFHAWAIETLSQAGPQICGRLCLEITETAAVTNMADAALFVEQVRGIGVRVALDDFGAGASSFAYLKTLPVDLLKIDGQFIRTLATDPLDEATVRCFVDVARVVGMKTVAEFVDDPEVLRRLGVMGVDFAQGYLLHRPAPLDELVGALPAARAGTVASWPPRQPLQLPPPGPAQAADGTVRMRPGGVLPPGLRGHALRIVEPAMARRHIPLTGEPLTIGRAAPADLVLEGADISRVHCCIELQDGRFCVTDLGSTNGTFVNGVEITGTVPLLHGTALSLGGFVLEYEQPGRGAPAGDATARSPATPPAARRRTIPSLPAEALGVMTDKSP